jgi:DSF synthase
MPRPSPDLFHVMQHISPCTAGWNSRSSANLDLRFDAEGYNTLWLTLQRCAIRCAHNFSVPLIEELYNLLQHLQQNDSRQTAPMQPPSVHYAVMRSGHPEYFSQGGDLGHFLQCIRSRNGEALYQYARLCLDIASGWTSLSAHGITTIALVQGKALGGGFEIALAADALIAEEHSQFSLPEIRFGLFPCTGAMSLLTQHVGVHEAERMMTNTRLYSAAELKEKGIIDVVCPRGEGEQAVRDYIAAHARRRLPRLALQRARRRAAPLDYQELLDIVFEWSEMALRLGEEELKVLDMLVRLQHGMRTHAGE